MTDSNIQQTLLNADLQMKDLLDLFGKNLMINFNSHHIGKIQEFDETDQTAIVSINYKKTFFLPDALGVYQPQLVDYPLMADVPVMCFGGGNGALTFPIKPGDDCLLCFNDRDLDNWFQGSSSSAVATSRLHSFADGIALVGLRSRKDVIVDYDTDGIALRTKDGLTKILIAEDGSKITTTVGPAMTVEIDATGKVKILNASGIDLVAALDKLFQDIQAGLVTTLLGPQPLVMPTFAVDLLVFETYKP